MALKPATRRATFTDESVNSYRFWTLTAGIDMSLYNENPILLWNHKRADELLPIGVMQDIRLSADGAMTGLPAFDDQDEFAMKLYGKYEAGMLNMFSAGFEPLEAATEAKYLKDKAPCLVKCRLQEISLTDIGSNRNAHKVKLYNNGKAIDLKDAKDLLKLFNDNSDTMIIIPKSVAELLNLTDSATETEVLTAIKEQNNVILALTTERNDAKNALKLLQDETTQAKIVALVDDAVAKKKITVAQKPEYVTLATGNFEAVKKVFDGMPEHISLQDRLHDDASVAHKGELAELLKLSGQELFLNGKMDRLKEISLSDFKVKYKEYTNEEFVEPAK